MTTTSTPTRIEPADAVTMASRLRLSATRLARRLRQEADPGLSPSQLSALATIEAHGPVTLGAVAEHERVAPPTITKVVAKLEAAALVERQPDAGDRRVARVALTPSGHALLATVRERKNAWLAAQLADLDLEQRRRLADALDILDSLTRAPSQDAM